MHEKQPLQEIKFATNASLSLFRGNPTVDIYRPVYDEVARTKPEEPLNREEEILPAYIDIVNSRDIVMPSRIISLLIGLQIKSMMLLRSSERLYNI